MASLGPSRRVARRTSRRTSRRQMAMYQGQQQSEPECYHEPEPQYAAPPPSPLRTTPRDPEARAMRDAGAITDEEFEAKKKQILGI